MKFTIEEINNSTDLLPKVTLGYEIFDYCSDIGSLPSAMDLLACGNSIHVGTKRACRPKVISVTGPYGSRETITVSQLFLFNLLPVVTHGASSVQLSNRQRFPSFFRTIPSDKFQVQAIVQILRKFRWNWVAFIGGDTDYSRDALAVFETDPNTCQKCQDYEWSGNGSTSCQNRTVVFLQHDAPASIVLTLAASSTILMCGCVLALFIRHYHTPVVKSAGGKMSLFVLVFLALSSVSIFFFGGRPSAITCRLRSPTFLVFYTATLSCLAVRSFQIISVFKLAAKLPKAYEFWVKHGGQWLIIAICTITQLLLSILFQFISASYKRMQVMKFTIEEINNSTDLLPGVTLGYEIFDYCSNIGSLLSAMDFLACGNSIHMGTKRACRPNVISVTGPFGSRETITVSQLFLYNLLPMVTHGASSVQLSNKQRFPSFFRTIPSDKFQVQVIVQILRKFRWNWVAFIGGDTDYSRDALAVFESEIKSDNICLAYRGVISVSNDSANAFMLDVIHKQNVEVIVLFAHTEHVRLLLRTAIKNNVQKVWIGSEAWTLSSELIKENNIERLGTVLGVTLHQMGPLKGFKEFIQRSVSSTPPSSPASGGTCGQVCEECTNVTAETIYSQDPTFSFSIYSAVYAIAHALHSTLSCSPSSCMNLTVEPHMAPELRCSPECPTGFRRVKKSFHSCCFDCEICLGGTYINYTADPNTCQKCQDYEWSGNGSTSCQNRTVVFLQHDGDASIVLTLAASSTILLCGCVLALFIRHYDTPVVKSAGGKMSLLVLVFLALSSVSIFLLGGRPSPITCSLGSPTFLVFYTATLSCLAVRSFQIVSIFKLAAKLPRAYEFWVKHGGQWLIIAICTITQLLLSILWVFANGPQPSQVTHGASSVQLSNKQRFPSFFRTIPSDKFQVQAIVQILREFQWNWVAFIGGDTDYSRDALAVFESEIKTAIEKNVQKVWIGSETWTLSSELIKENNIERLGTVLGVTLHQMGPLKGLKEFIQRSVSSTPPSSPASGGTCGQSLILQEFDC
ncbi:taste receptor type 1 member 1-like [Sardina pilchardus]|uniref:taste receptor type 1 member 1-like n=1 Tax=Sardina pilchardus TaxID=27697 RepID=UPI002E1582B5